MNDQECGPSCWVRYIDDPHDCAYIGLRADGGQTDLPDLSNVPEHLLFYYCQSHSSAMRVHAWEETERRKLADQFKEALSQPFVATEPFDETTQQ